MKTMSSSRSDQQEDWYARSGDSIGTGNAQQQMLPAMDIDCRWTASVRHQTSHDRLGTEHESSPK